MLARAIAQPPCTDGVRRSRWAAIRNCFDDQTEILTEQRGWQLFKNLTEDDKVATIYEGHTLGFEKPSYHYAAHYKGEMVGLDCEGGDMLVTPDHKVYTSKCVGRRQEWLPYDFEFAKTAYGKLNRKLLRKCRWEGVKHDGVNYSEDFFEFLGYWFAEGSCGKYESKTDGYVRRRLVLTTCNDAWYARRVLERAGLPYSRNARVDGGYNFVVNVTPDTRKLINELCEYGGARDKFVPQYVKDAPPLCIAAFLRGFLMGDGGVAGGGKTVTAYTSSKQLA
jgi:hypothetical protein